MATDTDLETTPQQDLKEDWVYFLVSLGTALLLAIPTWGFSLVLFFLIKNWFDTRAMNSLLGAAATAMREEVSEERYHINRAAIAKVFKRFGVEPPQIQHLGNDGTTLYWGMLRHPMIQQNREFSVRFGYTPRDGTRNTVFIKAAPGRDESVLGADDIMSLASTQPGGVAYEKQISRIKPKSDQEIIQLILQAARSRAFEIDCPRFEYGKLADFVSRHELGVEYFPGYSGARFWIDIGEYSYAVCIENLDPDAKDAGGISIWAKQDGPAEVLISA
ncbi:hypothetical protein [Massilia arenae]|uniref:Uncharacterized protein n=1 Tax=Massilia arenae TaxID=2603288 RepID=A0A5C7FPQ3_9BURK|nr:hypothetical protein [Massilia arenae]TXF96213.1 hypothetical protein FVD38_25075 [Massilia arenae]